MLFSRLQSGGTSQNGAREPLETIQSMAGVVGTCDRHSFHSNSAAPPWATLFLFLVLITPLLGCTDTDPANNPLAASCSHRIPTTSKSPHPTQHIAHPETPTSCMVVIFSCNFCVYDNEGELLGAESETCGVCFQTEF